VALDVPVSKVGNIVLVTIDTALISADPIVKIGSAVYDTMFEGVEDVWIIFWQTDWLRVISPLPFLGATGWC
jgi:hypothetical protein